MSAPSSDSGRAEPVRPARWWPGPRHSQSEVKLRCKTFASTMAEIDRLRAVIERDEAAAANLLAAFELMLALDLLDEETAIDVDMSDW